MVSNVQSHYRKVSQGTLRNSEIFCEFIPPSFFEPVSADVLLLQMVTIAPVWTIVQPPDFSDAVVGDGFAIDRTV